MNKNYHGEAVKFVELIWFCSIARQSKLAKQWKDAHLGGKLKRGDGHLLVTSRLTHPARAGRDKLELKSGIWAVSKQCGVVFGNLMASTGIDTLVARQKYITNHAVDEHRRTPLCTGCT